MGSTLRRTDLLDLSNLRNDGRKPHEIRRMRTQITEHGALVEMGLTTVLATVRGPIECTRRSEEVPDRYVLRRRLATMLAAEMMSDTSHIIVDKHNSELFWM